VKFVATKKVSNIFTPNVADLGCLSWIPDPYFYLSRIFCHSFFCSLIFHKNENYVSFELLKKKIGANFKRIVEYITKKIVTKWFFLSFMIFLGFFCPEERFLRFFLKKIIVYVLFFHKKVCIFFITN
jgi:hypothetical protein